MVRNYNSWVEIDRKAILHNLSFFKTLVSQNVVLVPVVKSNAYGHGLKEIVSILKEEKKAFYFATFSSLEALRVKEIFPEARVLVLGYLDETSLEDIIEKGIEVSVYRKEVLNLLKKYAQKLKKKARIHLKLETGTNRLGFLEDEFKGKIIDYFKKNQGYFEIEGIFTHFANIEDSTNHLFAMRQWGKFLFLSRILEETLKITPVKHYACSAATLLFGDSIEGVVRLGVSLYGLWPSRETYLSYLLKYGERAMADALKPVLSWKTRIIQLKKVFPGETIGYGLTYQVTRESLIATLPVGYWDGYDRGFSNKSYVLINGKRAPVRGRVCMNLMMVDVSDINSVKVGDEVILLGKSGEEEISADTLASWAGTINYEIVTRINPLLPRLVV